MNGDTLGEILAAYYRAHPCWICTAERIMGKPWCSHREPKAALADLVRLGLWEEPADAPEGS
jgi:hypothetical protein